MKVREWNKIKEVSDLTKLEVGDFFLTGENIIKQKETKIIGKEITYFKLLKKDKSFEYIPIYDILEEESKD